MHAAAPLTRLVLALIVTLIATPASAQSRFYVGGAALADIRRFDRIEIDPRILADLFDSSSPNGIAPGGGVRMGTFVHPLWSLELAVDAGTSTTSAFRNPAEIFPARSSTLRFPVPSNSTSFLTVSTVVGFHPEARGRVRLGYLGGLTFVRGTYESNIPDFSYVPIDISFISDSPLSGALSSVTFPVPRGTSRSVRRTDLATGALVGLEAVIDLRGRFALVPGVRAIVFSNQGQSVLLIRPEAGVRWNF